MQKKEPKRVRWLALFLICGVIIYCYNAGISQMDAQIAIMKQDEGQYRAQYTQLQKEQRALRNEIEQAGTDAYIENKARTEYGFLKPGEIRFEITNPEALYADKETAQIAVMQQGNLSN